MLEFTIEHKNSSNLGPNCDNQEQDWENEVDSLVQWTNDLGDVDSIY